MEEKQFIRVYLVRRYRMFFSKFIKEAYFHSVVAEMFADRNRSWFTSTEILPAEVELLPDERVLFSDEAYPLVRDTGEQMAKESAIGKLTRAESRALGIR